MSAVRNAISKQESATFEQELDANSALSDLDRGSNLLMFKLRSCMFMLCLFTLLPYVFVVSNRQLN